MCKIWKVFGKEFCKLSFLSKLFMFSLAFTEVRNTIQIAISYTLIIIIIIVTWYLCCALNMLCKLKCAWPAFWRMLQRHFLLLGRDNHKLLSSHRHCYQYLNGAKQRSSDLHNDDRRCRTAGCSIMWTQCRTTNILSRSTCTNILSRSIWDNVALYLALGHLIKLIYNFIILIFRCSTLNSCRWRADYVDCVV